MQLNRKLSLHNNKYLYNDNVVQLYGVFNAVDPPLCSGVYSDNFSLFAGLGYGSILDH